EAVAGVRHAVGRGRTFVKHELGRASPGCQGLLIDVLGLPEFEDFDFQFGEANRRGNGTEHGASYRVNRRTGIRRKNRPVDQLGRWVSIRGWLECEAGEVESRGHKRFAEGKAEEENHR